MREYLQIRSIKITNEDMVEFQVVMKNMTLEQAVAQLCVPNKTFELGKTGQPQRIVRSITQILGTFLFSNLTLILMFLA